jgi:Bacterial Ig domain
MNVVRAAWDRRLAVLGIAGLTFALSCTPDETLRLSPQEASLSVPQGGSRTIGLSFQLPKRRNIQSVTLPASVDVVGVDSDIPSAIHVTADPPSVTIADRDTTVSSTLTVEADADTPLGTHVVVIQPNGTAKHLKVESLRLTLDVVQGESPIVTIDSPQRAFVGGDTLTISATVTDAQNDFDSWEILLDGNSVKTGGAADPVAADADISAFDEGSTHTVEVNAKDTAGHTGSASKTFTIDRGAPDAMITQPTDGTVITGGGSLRIAGSVSDPEDHFDHFDLKLDDGLLTDGTTPGDVVFDLDTSTVPGGRHTISLTATDQAGNVTTAQVTITLDNGNPTTTPTVEGSPTPQGTATPTPTPTPT